MEDYALNISVKKKSNIPNDSAEIVNFQFSHYKSMETISCHSNQSSYLTGIKKTSFRSPTCRCYMYNMERIGLRASEEMLFENVDGRTTDGRTPGACIYYKLNYEPTAQVS